jgi:hypothetical protein
MHLNMAQWWSIGRNTLSRKNEINIYCCVWLAPETILLYFRYSILALILNNVKLIDVWIDIEEDFENSISTVQEVGFSSVYHCIIMFNFNDLMRVIQSASPRRQFRKLDACRAREYIYDKYISKYQWRLI